MSALTERYCNIQMLIMPVLQEEFYDLSGKAKEFAELLELVRPGKYLSPVAAMTGRPALNRGKILHALFLKSLQNIPTTKAHAEGGYEGLSSRYAAPTGDKLIAAQVDQLKDLVQK